MSKLVTTNFQTPEYIFSGRLTDSDWGTGAQWQFSLYDLEEGAHVWRGTLEQLVARLTAKEGENG